MGKGGTRSPSYSASRWKLYPVQQGKKGNKRHIDRQARRETVPSADDIIG